MHLKATEWQIHIIRSTRSPKGNLTHITQWIEHWIKPFTRDYNVCTTLGIHSLQIPLLAVHWVKKRAELTRFIQPAQNDETFRQVYDGIISNYLDDTVTLLGNHYKRRLKILEEELHSMPLQHNVSPEQVWIAIKIAIKWANRILVKSWRYSRFRNFTDGSNKHKGNWTLSQ